MESLFVALSKQLDDLMLCDKQRLQRRLQQAQKHDDLTITEQLETDILLARQRLQLREASYPSISYPLDLPVSQKKQALSEAIRDNQVVIVAGETGSGKTTQLPKICLELGRGSRGLIGHTQPRRLAARMVATRIAEELQTPLGQHVGYKIRFTDQISDMTLIKLMTDGILLAEIQHDRLLLQYDTIIIDEAHERSLNIDFILGYLKQLLPSRPDLKIIITSATIDPQRFSNHFNNAPVVEVSGRTYPVEVRYRPLIEENDNRERDRIEALCEAVDELDNEAPGDVLIFMSGEREIRDAAEALNRRELRHTEILPLYARLSNSEQNRIFQTHQGRRIVIATNVAETSLTVPGIKYVIDTGTVRISRYSHRTKVQRLPIEPISQASANQRQGRCGRVSAGICIRLYSEQDFFTRPAFTDPEILRTNLASVILRMAALDLGEIANFPFVDAPDKRHIQDGIKLLQELGAMKVKGSQYQLTALGRQLAQLPIDPRLAKMVLQAQKHACVKEIMIITAALSIQEPRERPQEKQQAADEKHRRFVNKESDFLALVNLWHYLQEQQEILSAGQFRKLCKSDYLNYLRIREWQDVYTQLRQTVRELGLSINSIAADYRSVHLALLSGLLSHIGQKESDKAEFIGARNTRFAIFPGSALFKKPPKWVMVAELVETSRLWGRVAARIEPDWIEPLAQHLVKRHYSEPHWSKSQGAVMASEKVTLYGLPIVTARRINYGAIDPPLSRELFIRHALVEGDWHTNHQFFRQNLQLLAEVEELEHKTRRRDILVDEESLLAFYAARLPDEIVSSRHFDHWWKKTSQQQPDLLTFEKSMLIKEGAIDVSQQDYPNYWQQGNIRLPLSYHFEPGATVDGITVEVPLAVLNQVDGQGFDWQVPGLRRQLIIELIKSLPKSLRRHFVPAPNYADAFLERVTPQQGNLLDVLEQELRRMTGVTVSRDDWRFEQISHHLKINFRVTTEHHKTIAESNDFNTLKQNLKSEVQQTLASLVENDIEQRGLQTWNFGTLPNDYQQKRGNYTVKAYPALVDETDSVAIRLFETQHEQQKKMWAGIRRLLLLNTASPIKFLHETLPNKAKLGLYFNPFGHVLSLIDDCIACGIDHLMQEFGGLVWQEQDFIRLLNHVRAGLNQTVVQIAQQVEKILTTAHGLNKKLKGRIDINLVLSLADIKNQLSQLIFPGFVTLSGWRKLADILRYLQAIERRMEKMSIDPQRDRLHLLKIEQMQQCYQQSLNKLSAEQAETSDVKEIRWMIEELRVSYFAQQLGTAYPISEKRIRQKIEQAAK